jgi:hypothetical protein
MNLEISKEAEELQKKFQVGLWYTCSCNDNYYLYASPGKADGRLSFSQVINPTNNLLDGYQPGLHTISDSRKGFALTEYFSPKKLANPEDLLKAVPLLVIHRDQYVATGILENVTDSLKEEYHVGVWYSCSKNPLYFRYKGPGKNKGTLDFDEVINPTKTKYINRDPGWNKNKNSGYSQGKYFSPKNIVDPEKLKEAAPEIVLPYYQYRLTNRVDLLRPETTGNYHTSPYDEKFTNNFVRNLHKYPILANEVAGYPSSNLNSNSNKNGEKDSRMSVPSIEKEDNNTIRGRAITVGFRRQSISTGGRLEGHQTKGDYKAKRTESFKITSEARFSKNH